MPAALDAEHQGERDELNAKSEKEYDGGYGAMQVKPHEQALRLFQSYARIETIHKVLTGVERFNRPRAESNRPEPSGDDTGREPADVTPVRQAVPPALLVIKPCTLRGFSDAPCS